MTSTGSSPGIISEHPCAVELNRGVMSLVTFASDGRNQPRDDNSQQRVLDVTSMESHGFDPVKENAARLNKTERRSIGNAAGCFVRTAPLCGFSPLIVDLRITINHGQPGRGCNALLSAVRVREEIIRQRLSNFSLCRIECGLQLRNPCDYFSVFCFRRCFDSWPRW
jgi:hypothetical protein